MTKFSLLKTTWEYKECNISPDGANHIHVWIRTRSIFGIKRSKVFKQENRGGFCPHN